MSQLIISWIFKPSVCKKFLRHTNVRLFSSTTLASRTSELNPNDKTKVDRRRPFSSTPAYPYLMIDYMLNIPHGDSSPDYRVTTYDLPSKEKQVLIMDKELIKEVYDATTEGFSYEGVRFHLWYKTSDDNSLSLHPVISYKPDPELEEMTIYLPPLPTGSKIESLAMSSTRPVRDKDWVVGVKLSGSRLSLCRPFGSCKWINIKTMPQSINPLSSLMFFETDNKFYIPTPGGNLLCSLDPHSEEEDHLDFIDLEYDHLPKSVFQDLADVSAYSRTDHLVESPTGQLFLVKWYGEDLRHINNDSYFTSTLMHVTKKFMVFREGEQSNRSTKTMIYTEDIGDLCIFLGHSAAVCISASWCAGLKPNCIYFVGYNFGVYDLTTKICTIFYTENEVPLRKLEFPYWPPPASN